MLGGAAVVMLRSSLLVVVGDEVDDLREVAQQQRLPQLRLLQLLPQARRLPQLRRLVLRAEERRREVAVESLFGDEVLRPNVTPKLSGSYSGGGGASAAEDATAEEELPSPSWSLRGRGGGVAGGAEDELHSARCAARRRRTSWLRSARSRSNRGRSRRGEAPPVL